MWVMVVCEVRDWTRHMAELTRSCVPENRNGIYGGHTVVMRDSRNRCGSATNTLLQEILAGDNLPGCALNFCTMMYQKKRAISRAGIFISGAPNLRARFGS